MKNNLSKLNRTVETKATIPTIEDSEASQAAQEYAMRIKRAPAHLRAGASLADYEVRPCAGVRGYTLKLPVLGWRLWYPNAADALQFARRVAVLSAS